MSKRRNKRAAITLHILAFAWLLPAKAVAFHQYATFAQPVEPGQRSSGGNGIFFTGSPRWGGLDCTACHTGGAALIRVELSSDPPELFSELRYTPGAEYLIRALMVGEHAFAPNQSHNLNSFLMELDDEFGNPVAQYRDPAEYLPPPERLDWNLTKVLGVNAGGTEWKFYAQMPVAGTGAVTLYLSALDGDSSGNEFNDDVWTGSWLLCEANLPCQSPPSGEEAGEYRYSDPATGCAMRGPVGGTGWLWFVAATGLLRLRLTRSRRRRLGTGVMLGAIGLAGCQELDEEAPLPDLDFAAFRCNVQPVLVARCSFYACHGNALRPLRLYGPNRLRIDPSPATLAAPLTAAEEQNNFDMARGFASSQQLDQAWLLYKPLDVDAGGLFHGGKVLYRGRDVFTSRSDPGFVAIEAWLGGAMAPPTCEPTDAVGP